MHVQLAKSYLCHCSLKNIVKYRVLPLIFSMEIPVLSFWQSSLQWPQNSRPRTWNPCSSTEVEHLSKKLSVRTSIHMPLQTWLNKNSQKFTKHWQAKFNKQTNRKQKVWIDKSYSNWYSLPKKPEKFGIG